MKSETFAEGQGAAFLAALHGKRPKRAKPGGTGKAKSKKLKAETCTDDNGDFQLSAFSSQLSPIPRPAPGSTRGQVGDWTAGKSDKALALGLQLGYDHRQWVFAFRCGAETETYENIDTLLAALVAGSAGGLGADNE